MSDKELYQIQMLQFTNLEAANERMKNFLNKELPFQVESVNIRPLAVSLNSINGILSTKDGKKLFFKTHVEPQSIINEYYNSSILAEAGYPVIQPIFSSTEWGKQLLIYEFFEAPSLFNVAWEIETGKRNDADSIITLQQKADSELWKIYQNTLQILKAEAHAQAPIHQLFYHRLTGGRFSNFYEGKEIILPGYSISFEKLAKMKWCINGIEFKDSLGEIIQRASATLNPSRCDTPSIIGHGDAHNGNVFVEENRLIYFNPAFAGRHSPFLDLTKPLFHNVFAIWMYFPNEVACTLSINLKIQGDRIIVEHDFMPSKIRREFLYSKLQFVLKPLLEELKSKGWLTEDWQEYLKLALFCCPFLTMNLSDRQKFTPEIGLLGLALSVEMGSRGNSKTLIDRELDAIASGVWC